VNSVDTLPGNAGGNTEQRAFEANVQRLSLTGVGSKRTRSAQLFNTEY
jgi:hypothetical protein